MVFREYIISVYSRDSIFMSFPGFSDDSDPDSARNMNMFYASAADKILRYAYSLPNIDNRRSHFSCRSSVEIDDSVINVKLMLSYSAERNGSRSPSLKRCITHTWKKKRKNGKFNLSNCFIEN